jgi:Transposase
MRTSRFSGEQSIRGPAGAEAGARTEEVCRRDGISTTTFYKWKGRYGALVITAPSSQEHPAAHLAEFEGVLQVDGYSLPPDPYPP